MKKLIRDTFLLMLVLCMIAGAFASAETYEVSAKKKSSTNKQAGVLSPEEQFANKYPKLKTLADNGSIGLITRKNTDRETIKLGKYFLPNDYYDKEETRKDDLVWEILEYSEDGKSAFVVSKYLFKIRQFDLKYKGVTWENCELRKWLNSDFINDAFSESERKLIKQVNVKTEAPKGKSKTESKNGDIVTEDCIFLLSKDELDRYYMPQNADKDKNYDGVSLFFRICRYRGGDSTGWFLRSNGYEKNNVLYVSYTGEIKRGSTDWDEAVRPAFWVDLTPELIKKNNLSIGGTSGYADSDVYVTFGNHDNSRLEWLVGNYDETENKALLISKTLVNYMAFKPGYENDNSWKDSDIRSWLNGDFYKSSFSNDEIARIKNTVIDDVGKNSTKDKVFLLSVGEVENYLAEARYRYGVYPDGALGFYWLRTPVNSDMSVYYVDEDGLFKSEQHICAFGVRPAIYIDLDPNLNAENYVPDAPEISAEVTVDGTGIIITTEKLPDAAGFEVFLKAPDSSEFENAETIARDGSVSRGCIIRHLTPGEYVIKVRAYMENGDKKVYSAFSTEKKLVLEAFTDTEFLKENYSKLQGLADKNLIGLVSGNSRDTVKFGKWDEKDIEWEILEYSEDGNSALVMSKNILCYRQFNDVDADIKWQDSSLRKWLNNDFIKTAFSKSEKKLIKKTTITNEGNTYFETAGGKDTEDSVFLLSASEYEKYVEDTKQNGYTDRSIGFDLNGKNGSFWLRTQGREGSDKNFDGWDEEDWEDYEEEDYLYGYAAFVYDDGELYWEGTGVAYEALGVRPVMWIKLSDKIKKNNDLSLKNNKNTSKLYVTFGMEVNGESYNPLEWEVLDYDEKNNKVLLLSRYSLGTGAYYKKSDADKGVTWAESTIRKWLNNDFYNTMFNEEEMALIKKVKIINEDNEKFKTKGGKDTKDKVFLLSLSEVQKYLGSESLDSDSQDRICHNKDGEVTGWWLRSPGNGNSGKKSSAASYVNGAGIVMQNAYVRNYEGIRPAIWISLK